MQRYLVAAACAFVVVVLPSAANAASPGLYVSSYELGRVEQGLSTGAHEIIMYVNWASFQPSNKGQIDKAYMDALIAAVKKINEANRRVHLIVNGAPAWANGGHAEDPNYAPLPEHHQDFADFIAKMVNEIKKEGGKVDRLQPWTEPDDPQYWKPQPSDLNQYASMLRRTYDAVKDEQKGDPRVSVFNAATAGNNYVWLDQLLPQVAGKFDGIAIDNPNSCATTGPDSIYREPDGRLGRFTYMGFLEVLNVMDKHGLQHMPLLFASTGWSSTNGGPTSCTRGAFAGKKPDGVSEEEQARMMRVSYACIAGHPRVSGANWFRLEDTVGDPLNEFNHYGLYRADGSPKPSLQVFKELAASNGGPPGFCADLTPPTLKIHAPFPGEQFEDRFDFQVSATDNGGAGLARISLFSPLSADSIRNFTDGLADDRVYGLTPWFGGRGLPLGKHTLRVDALDRNGNVATATVQVEKVKPGTIKPTRSARYALPKRVLGKNCTKRARRPRCTANFGRLQPVVPGPSIQGKVSVQWQWRNRKRQWRKLIGGTKPANQPLAFTATLRRKGHWRVRAVYKAHGHYKTANSKYFAFRVR